MDGVRGNRFSAYDPLNYPVFEQIRRQQQGFTDVAAWSGTSFNLADGETRPARGLFVSGTFFNASIRSSAPPRRRNGSLR